jgi:hypothetical protein
MKYLAILFLSLAASFTARTAPTASAEANMSMFAPVLVSGVSNSHDETSDRALAVVVAAALIALQLRRRQKSMRMPRQFR